MTFLLKAVINNFMNVVAGIVPAKANVIKQTISTVIAAVLESNIRYGSALP